MNNYAYYPIYKQTLTAASSSFEITDIPPGFDDLFVSITGYGTNDDRVIRVRFNGDSTSSNYSYQRFLGYSVQQLSQNYTSSGAVVVTSNWSNVQTSSVKFLVHNYSNTNIGKVVTSDLSDNSEGWSMITGVWNQSTPITSMNISVDSGSFVAGTQIGIYGVYNALNIPVGETVTTGGQQVYIDDEGYKVHIFESIRFDQIFSVQSLKSSIEAEVFMWGAAGGGSNAEGGLTDPGGAGGYSYGKFSISSPGNYAVQVGEGGLTGYGTSFLTRPRRSYPNAGLPSVRSGYKSGSGGGRSAIFNGLVTSAANALIVAGGGGGAAGNGGGNTGNGCHGGSGNGNNATTGRGHSSYITETNNGATLIAGGTTSSGSGNGGSAQFRGADAGNGTSFGSSGWNAAGGGGDGWYGGGSINSQHIGGGGGSGYINSSIVTDGVMQSTGLLPEARRSSTTPPQTGNQYYRAGIAAGVADNIGGNGLVVVRYAIQ